MRFWTVLLILILTACAPKADPNVQIQVAVLQTLAAMPTGTSQPPPIPLPTTTPFDLAGLFCEYQFCVGHPTDMAFFDVSAQKNPAAPSTYSQGIIAAFNANLFIQMIWQIAPGTADPQFMLDLILDDVDTRVGSLDVKLIRDMNVIYTPITSTATPVLPFGAAGAWICGERAFAWKVYSPQADNTRALFEQALERFQCKR
ncbi:MAG: hypothetical protein Kow0070_06930 [Anaerolineales bacterium]